MFTGTLQQQVTLDIPLLIAGQRGARIARADADIEAARARVAAGSSTLAAEAGSLFTGLQAAEDSARIIESTRDELLRLTHIVKARGESGMASTFDLARMEVELATVETRLADARADIVERSGQLATLLGIRGWQPRAAKSLNTLALPVSTIAKPRDGVMTSPAVIAAQNEESAAKLGVDVAKSERWPVPSLSLGRAWTSEPFGSANYVGLSVELPLLDTRRGLQARAESDATAATLRRELAESETAARLEQYAGIIRIREAALAEHDRKAGARLPGLRQMAEDAYRLGRGTVFDLLDATRSRAELQQTKVELLAALVDAQIRYLAASGNWAMLEKSAKQ
jgi:cobalt-zinc-cadmium efflux system outer membrane protein